MLVWLVRAVLLLSWEVWSVSAGYMQLRAFWGSEELVEAALSKMA